MPGAAVPPGAEAPQGNPVEEIKAMETVSIKEEEVEGKKKVSITVLEETIKFDLVEETFGNESLPHLEKIGDAIKTFEGYGIEINVHTDNTGNPTYNMELSKNIGKSIMDYLVNVKVVQP